MNTSFNSCTTLSPSNNRLLIIDWASLSYHQIFALISKKKTSSYFDLDNAEDELYAWRSGMINKLLGYIKMFDPKDMVFTLEGTNVWRNEYCINYYKDNCVVYYDKTGYFVRFDNFLYKFFKKPDGEIDFQKLDVKTDISKLPKTSKKLKDLPERITEMFWEHVLPKYKGNRLKKDWPFEIDKNSWKKFKDEYAYKVSKIFRSHVIKSDTAEGDDVVYVATKYWEKKYDSIILITGDSDFNQLLNQKNLQIYNHRTDAFVDCRNPKDYLEIKVLAGDRGDNISGMALPGKKTQLAEAGATKLYESAVNCVELAEKEGWINQYLRNKKLIDLNNIPTHIQRELCEMFDKSVAQLGDITSLYALEVTEELTRQVTQMQNLGFKIFHSLDEQVKKIDPNPQRTIDGKRIQAIKEKHKMEASRVFDSFEGVF